MLPVLSKATLFSKIISARITMLLALSMRITPPLMAGAPVSDNSHHIICSNESTSAASKGYATFVKTRLMSYATNSANTNTVLTKMGKLDKYGCAEKIKKFTFRQGLSFLIGQPKNNSTTCYTKEDIETVINIGKGLVNGDLILQNKWLNGRHCSVVGNRFLKKLLIGRFVHVLVNIEKECIQKVGLLRTFFTLLSNRLLSLH